MTPVLPGQFTSVQRNSSLYGQTLYLLLAWFYGQCLERRKCSFKEWKARAVYGRSKHNLWTYILKRVESQGSLLL